MRVAAKRGTRRWVTFCFLLSSPGGRNASREALHQQRSWSSSGTCATPVWIPARRCAPSGMTTNEGADRDDVKKKGAPTGMMAREGARRPG